MSHAQYCNPEMTKSSKRSQSKTDFNMMGSRELRPMGLFYWLSNEANLPMHSAGHLPLLRTDSHGEKHSTAGCRSSCSIARKRVERSQSRNCR